MTEMKHAERVAAWSAEVAARIGLSRRDREALERAAILHHLPKAVVDHEALSTLLRDLGTEGKQLDRNEIDRSTEVLEAMHGRGPSSDRIKKMARILEQSDDLDSACELDATVSAEAEVSGLDGLIRELGTLLRIGGVLELERAAENIPVFPGVAYKAVELLRDESLDPGTVDDLISSDATLAGYIVAAANSASNGGACRAATIRQAWVRIGAITARRIILAASLRCMFSGRHSHALWNHSLDVAQRASAIARFGENVEPEQAFLAGLVHDIGKLAILGLSVKTRRSCDRLTDRGCPDLVVERVVIGEGHPEIGTKVLQAWNFSGEISEAVDSHHESENAKTALGGVLFLAEEATGSNEALASDWRHQRAMELAGLDENSYENAMRHDDSLDHLRFAA